MGLFKKNKKTPVSRLKEKKNTKGTLSFYSALYHVKTWLSSKIFLYGNSCFCNGGTFVFLDEDRVILQVVQTILDNFHAGVAWFPLL